MAGSKYSSAGSVVGSPGAGTAYRWPGCCGDDFVCANLDSGGSIAVGHLSDRIPSGSRVDTGTRIGSVAWPHPSNGDYAHIHVQAQPEPDCTESSDPVAFDVAHGFRWACTPDLPYSGEANQYSRLAVKRCKSAGTPVEAPAVDFGQAFASRKSFLETAHVFENLGVGAYLGAAGFIQNKDILQAAAGIFGVEARHAAVIGNMLGLAPEGGVYMGSTETPQDKAAVLKAATPFLAGAGAMAGGAAATL